jgi:hypothetical protein
VRIGLAKSGSSSSSSELLVPARPRLLMVSIDPHANLPVCKCVAGNYLPDLGFDRLGRGLHPRIVWPLLNCADKRDVMR